MDADAITAVAAVVTALGLLVTAIATLRRSGRTEKAVAEVHTMVNQQRTDMMKRVDVLADALRAAGVAVPPPPAEPEGS